MKGDFSRVSFDPRRNVRTVTVQQGRVLTDADLNEGTEAALRRIETEALDIIGPDGAPAATGGFKILPPAQANGPFRLSAGRLYADGLQVENHAETALPAIAGSGRKLVCLKATVDHMTGVEEPRLRDSALGDADTAGRAVVRTEIVVLDAAPADQCGSANAAFDALRAASGGSMRVSLSPVPPSPDPCKLTPQGGYTRLENLLYRLEVHGGTQLGGPGRFALAGLQVKVSRNNASEVARITSKAGNRVTLATGSRDGMPVFRQGEYAELLPADGPYDAAATGTFTRIDNVDGDTLVLADASSAVANGRVRLWSHQLVTLTVANPVISLEGLDFTFGGANFRLGDYWTVPARYAQSDIDPIVAKNTDLPPQGPRVVLVKLGLLTVNNGVIDPNSVTDCRHTFAPLTQAVALDYGGGDGQAIRPPTGGGAATVTDPLPSTLRAIVRIGGLPAPGAIVRFALVAEPNAIGDLSSTAQGGPAQTNPVDVPTDAQGVAEVRWRLGNDPSRPTQRVTAELITTANPGQTPPPRLTYSATLQFASGVAYQPGACTALNQQTHVQGALDKLCQDIANLTAADIDYKDGACDGLKGIKNVQQALDKLCKDLAALDGPGKPKFITIRDMRVNAGGRPLENNETYDAREFLEGIVVTFSEPVVVKPRGQEPIARLIVDMPAPMGLATATEWRIRMGLPDNQPPMLFGTVPFALSGTVAIDGEKLLWRPTKATQTFLSTAPRHQFGLASVTTAGSTAPPPAPVFDERAIRGYFTLRGDAFWSEGNPDERRYLNGEMLLTDTPNNPFALARDQFDAQRAGDLRLWFMFKGG